MKKKALCVMLSAAMVATMFTGCGSKDSSKSSSGTNADGSNDSYTYEGASSDDGTELNIYCWNTEFQSRVAAHYPDYEEVDETTGKIGDVTVNWVIVANDNNAYQDNLDSALSTNGDKQADAAAADKIDIFLVEADYALKYVNTNYTLSLADAGVTDADVADQYQYTKDVVTDQLGNLKGSSWQGCPGLLFYRRDVATEVFGSDDAETVQAKVADWDTFVATAAELKDAGYQITCSANDTYRVYSNNVTSAWVAGDKVQIDANLDKWVEDSKALVDAGYTGTYDLWSDEWNAGMYMDAKVFCYFGPAWLINFCMHAEDAGSVANEGKWGAVVGPQGFYWGGTWICVANGTDNVSICKDIILKLTTDVDIMTEIVVDDDDFVNNQPAMEAMAEDTTYSSAVLGDMNPLALYAEGAKSIEIKYATIYDQGCNEAFQAAMKDYFEGTVDKATALQNFADSVAEKYPNLDVSGLTA